MHHSIELINVHVCLGELPVLKGVDIMAKPYEFISVVGANGAGKTTLLKVINGSVQYDQGKVIVLGEDLANVRRLSGLRRDIGVVSQRSGSTRFPIRAEEAVLMGRYGKIGLMRKPSKMDWKRAYEAMEGVGITRFSKKLVHELSGGEQQKVALARALAQDPSILLLDEPTTYLDSVSRSEIMEIIYSVHHQRGLTTLLVSHDPFWVEQYSDKIYLLENGKSRLIRG
ncbi:MAG: ATP-binding cassette domain-containing protein [Thermodesulfobacteriota bacterium]|nr:ATP-binding cassette domain-containing protein [Thermodesulfobacteriota bacterium]